MLKKKKKWADNLCDNLTNKYPLFFENTQLSLSSIVNIVSLSLSQNRNWKPHIFWLTKSASLGLVGLHRLSHFFSTSQLLFIYKDLIHLV